MKFDLDKNFQAITNITGLSLSTLLLYIMYLSYPDWKITLNFNAIGEAWFEVILLVFLINITALNFIDTARQIRDWKRQNGGLRSLF